jgi:hypothetical protein
MKDAGWRFCGEIAGPEGVGRGKAESGAETGMKIDARSVVGGAVVRSILLLNYSLERLGGELNRGLEEC